MRRVARYLIAIALGLSLGASPGPARAAKLPGRPAAVRMRVPVAPAERPASIGHPNAGRLEGAIRLDASQPYLRPVPASAASDALWGLPTLVRMVDRAARSVAKRYPTAVLRVGDISRRHGGEIAGHHSHESGRDVDLGFFAVDAKGKEVQSPSFLTFDGSLRSPSAPGAHFDLAKNWLLIERLLSDPEARVTHIFVAEPLRQRLLEFARSRGVPGRVLARAAVALMQPTHSLPHDDHFHVRIACPASMRATCVEFAKNAPRGARSKLAARKKSHGNLQVSRVAQKTKIEQPSRHIALSAPVAVPLRADAVAQEPLEMPFSHAGEDDVDGEAASDARDVNGAVDESGAAKITD